MTRIIIRGVPSRQPQLDYLARHLPDAVILMDPAYGGPDADNRANATNNFLRALKLQGEDGCIHMEDDAVLTTDFRRQVEEIIDQLPRNVVQFFSRRKPDLRVGSRWDRMFNYAICFYLPPLYAPALAAYFPGWLQRNPQHPGGLDLAVSDWLAERQEKHWIHCPSLVDHRVGTSSIDRRRSSRRCSLTFKDPAP